MERLEHKGTEEAAATPESVVADLAAIGDLLTGIEDRLVDASRRVAEADGRLERELDRVMSDVTAAIQELRGDVAAAIADVRRTVDGEVLARIEALEAEVQTLRDAD